MTLAQLWLVELARRTWFRDQDKRLVLNLQTHCGPNFIFLFLQLKQLNEKRMEDKKQKKRTTNIFFTHL
jgi:hypothetical protein